MQLRVTHKFVLIIGIITSIFACDKGRKFDAYISFGASGWDKENPASFQFQIQDTLSKNDLFINIRNTNEYQFSNLFVITELIYPNGFYVIDTLEYEMADEQGKWLGKGFTDLKQSKLFYKESFVFPILGDYQINIQQAMRKRDQIDGIQNLKGISDVGFRVETVR